MNKWVCNIPDKIQNEISNVQQVILYTQDANNNHYYYYKYGTESLAVSAQWEALLDELSSIFFFFAGFALPACFRFLFGGSDPDSAVESFAVYETEPPQM